MLRFYALLFSFLALFSHAEEGIPAAQNFFDDAQKVWKEKIPILIMFSIPECAYCKKVKEDVINPMSNLEEYKKKVIVREVSAESFKDVKDFYNEESTENEVAFKYAVNFFPTVMLVDQYGAVLDKIVGVANEESYWNDLEEKIEKSKEKLVKQFNAL